LRLVATRRYADVARADTLLIAGGIGCDAAMRDARLLKWILRQSAKVERLGSICNGALLLGAAGLLQGRRATTHWAYFDRLAALAPGARIERDALYVQSGNIYTSAGVTAGMDLALALVEQDHGKATALAVAQELVLFLKRPGGQSQFSRYLQAQKRDDLFGELELWMLDHPEKDLSVDSLAARMSMSPRHFARLFAKRIGMSPGAYVRRLRVEEARRRIEEGARRLKQIARHSGFADEQALRRGFQKLVGITPAEYRERF
jgi:transcriptional regulator GlxA family with amidase domain